MADKFSNTWTNAGQTYRVHESNETGLRTLNLEKKVAIDGRDQWVLVPRPSAIGAARLGALGQGGGEVWTEKAGRAGTSTLYCRVHGGQVEMSWDSPDGPFFRERNEFSTLARILFLDRA